MERLLKEEQRLMPLLSKDTPIAYERRQYMTLTLSIAPWQDLLLEYRYIP